MANCTSLAQHRFHLKASPPAKRCQVEPCRQIYYTWSCKCGVNPLRRCFEYIESSCSSVAGYNVISIILHNKLNLLHLASAFRHLSFQTVRKGFFLWSSVGVSSSSYSRVFYVVTPYNSLSLCNTIKTFRTSWLWRQMRLSYTRLAWWKPSTSGFLLCAARRYL